MPNIRLCRVQPAVFVRASAARYGELHTGDYAMVYSTYIQSSLHQKVMELDMCDCKMGRWITSTNLWTGGEVVRSEAQNLYAFTKTFYNINRI